MQHIDQINRELREITAKCTTADLAVDPWPWPTSPAPLKLLKRQPQFYEYRNVPHTCNRCGLGSDAGWGYVCFRNDCPTKVTC